MYIPSTPPARKTTPRTIRAALVGFLAGAALGFGSTAAQAQPAPTVSLGLVRAAPETTVFSFGGRVPLDLGLYVAAAGGDLELHATRASYTAPITVRQVDPDNGAVRDLPPGSTAGWRGLKAFFDVAVRNRAGRVVHSRQYAFCPNSSARQRVHDDGPLTSRYVGGCGSFFPFVRGMIWGLDDGWAVGVFNRHEETEAPTPMLALRPGRYTATVRIASPYAELFSVAPEKAEVTVNLTVKRGRGGDVGKGGMARAHHARHAAAAGEAVPTVTDPDPATLPDLAALPAWNIRFERRGKREFLSFAASPWNAGPGPLVVEGFRRPGEATMDAFQYFHDANGDVVGRAPVGDMAYDPRRGHQHWHFLQFARYSLLDAGQREVVVSRKQAYCLAPTDAVDLTVPGALATEGVELWTQCGSPRALWVRETLYPGWADTYFQEAAGQALEVTGLPNGRYHVVVQVNPLGLLRERSAENNVETRTVTLSGRRGARRVTVAPWNGITR